MGVTLRDFTEAKLYPIAVVLSLDKNQLHITPGTNKAAPSNEWLSDQYRRVPGLPPALLVPPMLPTGAGIRASQMVKRVFMAASGGADTVAAKAAANGIPLNDMLQPHTTPTVLCHAHKKLHPTLIREIFHYITKEVADYADPIRRHPRHIHPVEADSGCQSKDVRDWGYRMMGLSALWSTRRAFRSLEKGRQAPAPGYAASKAKSSRHRKHSSSKATTEGASHSHSSSRHRIHSHMRMPHMRFPCEACIMATIGTRSQALVDLRAGMLSRVCAENADSLLRAKRHEKEGKKSSSRRQNASTATAASDATTTSSSSFKPKTFPHLWALLDVYINAFGPEAADEIRSRSEKLAMTLLMVRICETKRRRNQRDDDSRIRASRRHRSHRGHSHSHSHSHHKHHDEPDSSSEPLFVRVEQPPRMVTKNGHRLPLPLLPPKLDPWAKNHTTESEATTETERGPSEDNYEGYADGYIDADGAFYAANQDLDQSASVSTVGSQIMAGAPNEDGEAEYFYVTPDNDEDDEDEDHSAFLANEQYNLAAAMQGSVPAWEDDYQRHIFDTQSEMTYSALPPRAQMASSRQQSFVSVTVHSDADMGTDSEAEADPFKYDHGSFGRYGPSTRARLSTINDDPVSEVSESSASQVFPISPISHRSKIPSSMVSATESCQSSQASRSTMRSRTDPYIRPSNPEPPSSTVSRASGSSKVPDISRSSRSTHRTASTVTPAVARKPVPSRAATPKATYSVSRKPVPARPTSPVARRPVPSKATPSVARKPVPSTPTSPLARKPAPSCASSRPPITRYEQRPASSIYSSASSSRRSNHLASTPSSSSSRTSTTSSSSRRAPSTATSALDASTVKTSPASKRLPSAPSSSSVSSRLTRPTASSQCRTLPSHRQSAASTDFVSPSNRRPSAPESYVAMQNSMPRAYAPSISISLLSKTASTVTVQAKASGSRAPPSEVSASSTLSSLYSGYAGNGISEELYNSKDFDADSIAPDDSISVVINKQLLEEEQAQWEALQREQREAKRALEGQFGSEEALHSPEEVKWLQKMLQHAAPRRSKASSVASKMAPSAMPQPLFREKSSLASTQRSLNHYEPSIMRRPVGAPRSRAAEPAPTQAPQSKPSRTKPPQSKPSESIPSRTKSSLSKSPQPKPSHPQPQLQASQPKPTQPKPPRARHRQPSGLSDKSNLTEWPAMVWK